MMEVVERIRDGGRGDGGGGVDDGGDVCRGAVCCSVKQLMLFSEVVLLYICM